MQRQTKANVRLKFMHHTFIFFQTKMQIKIQNPLNLCKKGEKRETDREKRESERKNEGTDWTTNVKVTVYEVRIRN